jgi:hypothetical protein
VPPKKKPSKKGLRKKADDLARKLCHARGYCQAAGLDDVACGGPPNWAHIEGRRNLGLRWKEWNCLLLCGGHHMHYSDYPIKWGLFIETHFPENLARIRAYIQGPVEKVDYDAVIAELKEAEAALT